ncbi:S1/P1 nuclease [Rubripirellula lacrimiformis]|uniref:S1/P1 nuclease n=1 Tax=Rubripirellula lacrimiformis TaxID=1930273 RepID=UPI001C54D7F7|nr:S1/P1 nuclease [Rubripirellula lacrimiformis]
MFWIAILWLSLSNAAFAWSASGHHAVGVIAYQMMDAGQRDAVIEILRSHPQFAQHFGPPRGVTDPESIARWQIGIAGCWPDMIRDTDWDRPRWHYQNEASVVIGNVPTPGPTAPLPPRSTMDDTDLYLSQATELCVERFRNVSLPDSERAVAMCWILHLFADGHQPCHAGSLYSAAFPRGDRGANRIELTDGSNLHAAWDRLLGGYPSPNDVRQLVTGMGDIRGRMENEFRLGGGGQWLRPQTWIAESMSIARSHLYTDEVTGPVIAASRGLTPTVPPIRLSADYYLAAGQVARHRVQQAGYRAGAVIARCLHSPTSTPQR